MDLSRPPCVVVVRAVRVTTMDTPQKAGATDEGDEIDELIARQGWAWVAESLADFAEDVLLEYGRAPTAAEIADHLVWLAEGPDSGLFPDGLRVATED